MLWISTYQNQICKCDESSVKLHQMSFETSVLEPWTFGGNLPYICPNVQMDLKEIGDLYVDTFISSCLLSHAWRFHVQIVGYVVPKRILVNI